MHITANSSRRFRVALAFPGSHREYVAKVAEILAKQCGRSVVLYDKFHESELAGSDLTVVLDDWFRRESDLVAVFLAKQSAESKWCGLEMASIRALLLDAKERAPVMILRFDDTAIPGLPETYGYVDLTQRNPESAAAVIMDRLAAPVALQYADASTSRRSMLMGGFVAAVGGAVGGAAGAALLYPGITGVIAGNRQNAFGPRVAEYSKQDSDSLITQHFRNSRRVRVLTLAGGWVDTGGSHGDAIESMLEAATDRVVEIALFAYRDSASFELIIQEDLNAQKTRPTEDRFATNLRKWRARADRWSGDQRMKLMLHTHSFFRFSLFDNQLGAGAVSFVIGMDVSWRAEAAPRYFSEDPTVYAYFARIWKQSLVGLGQTAYPPDLPDGYP